MSFLLADYYLNLYRWFTLLSNVQPLLSCSPSFAKRTWITDCHARIAVFPALAGAGNQTGFSALVCWVKVHCQYKSLSCQTISHKKKTPAANMLISPVGLRVLLCPFQLACVYVCRALNPPRSTANTRNPIVYNFNYSTFPSDVQIAYATRHTTPPHRTAI